MSNPVQLIQGGNNPIARQEEKKSLFVLSNTCISEQIAQVSKQIISIEITWTPNEIRALREHFPPVERFLDDLKEIVLNNLKGPFFNEEQEKVKAPFSEFYDAFQEIKISFENMASHGVLYKDSRSLEKVINSSTTLVNDLIVLIKNHYQAPELHKAKFIRSFISGAITILSLSISLTLALLHIATIVPLVISLVPSCAFLLCLVRDYRHECGIRDESKKWNGRIEWLNQYKNELEEFWRTKMITPLITPLYDGQGRIQEAIQQGQQQIIGQLHDLLAEMREEMRAVKEKLEKVEAAQATAEQPKVEEASAPVFTVVEKAA